MLESDHQRGSTDRIGADVGEVRPEPGTGGASSRAWGPPLWWLISSFVAFGVLLWLLSIRMFIPREWGDGGYFIGAATRIQAGEIIYRDFQHNYPPGRMFSLALLLNVFGQQWVVIRLFWVVCHAAAAAAALRVGQRLMSPFLGLLLALAVSFNSVQLNKSVELLLSASILLILLRSIEGKTGPRNAGIQMAVVGMFRHDVALMGSLLFAVGLVLTAFLERDRCALAVGLRRQLRSLGTYTIAFCVTLLPLAGYLLSHGALGIALRELLVSGVEANAVLALPFPDFIQDWSPAGLGAWIISRNALFYIVPLVYGLALFTGVSLILRRERETLGAKLILVAGLGALLFVQVAVRTDLGHLNKAFVPAHVLTFWLVSEAALRLRAAWSGGRPVRVAFGAVGLFFAVLVPFGQFRIHSEPPESLTRVLRSKLLDVGPFYERVTLPYGHLELPRKQATRMREVVTELDRYADRRSVETLVAYPSGATFNFFYGYKSPVAYDVLRPGELGTNAAAILEEIKAARPRVLIRNSEVTNQAFCKDLSGWAQVEGYRKIRAAGMTFWIRQDDEAG